MGAKVTQEVHAAVLDLARTLPTAMAIAEAVNVRLGVSISRRTVAVILERTRGERADIAKNVVREVLTKTVASDLDILLKLRNQLEKLNDQAYERALTGDPVSTAEHRKNAAALTAVIDKRLHYSGADTPDTPLDELKSAADRLHCRLDRLSSGLGAAGTASGDSPDRGR